jgi:serine/threonine protein kinase
MTYSYAAPERIEDADAAGVPADIYALALVIIYIVTGKEVFKPENYKSDFALMSAVLKGAKFELPGV